MAGAPNGRIQPVYGIDGRARLDEREIDSVPGYRGMGPVRIGNQTYAQIQHDVYGSAILAVAHVFFDRRLGMPGRRGALPETGILGRNGHRRP